jgi:hypothetical protein
MHPSRLRAARKRMSRARSFTRQRLGEYLIAQGVSEQHAFGPRRVMQPIDQQFYELQRKRIGQLRKRARKTRMSRSR